MSHWPVAFTYIPAALGCYPPAIQISRCVVFRRRALALNNHLQLKQDHRGTLNTDTHITPPPPTLNQTTLQIMDGLSKKIQNLGIHDFRNAARFAQNVIVQYEPYQIDVRRATNTDAWGPTPKHLQKVLRNRYQVPLYLITEYILKRLIDHIASRPKNLYEKARKEYVNYGSEWRVVMKCLIVIEYLLLNVDSGDELNQVRSCLITHKQILSRQVTAFKIGFSNDGKMEVHERGIRKKGETIIQYIDEPQFLKKARADAKKNNLKVRQQTEEAMYSRPQPQSYNANEMDDPAGGNYDFDDDDEEYASGTPASSSAPKRQPSKLEQQRKQRREILRERIRNTEQQRKNNEAAANVPDLLDFDAPEPQTPKSPVLGEAATTTSSVPGSFPEANDDEDDEFGDFQSDNSPKPAAQNTQDNLDDLLNMGGSSSAATPAATTTTAPATSASKDPFADLFNNSKSLI